MPARWFWEWWVLHCEEPWDEGRADLRAWAHVLLGMGAKGVELTWPYCENWTAEDIRLEMDRIEQATCNGDSGKDLNCDRSPDGHPAKGVR